MYVMHYRWHRHHPVATRHLYEMTRQQFLAKVGADREEYDQQFIRISAPEAHAFVRTGGVHSTYLWVDDTGRIRRANPSH